MGPLEGLVREGDGQDDVPSSSTVHGLWSRGVGCISDSCPSGADILAGEKR